MSEDVGPSLMQLVAHIPLLVVYLIGIALAIVLRRRAEVASTLALVGLALLLTLSLIQPFVLQYVIQTRVGLGSSSGNLTQILAVLGIVTSLIHAAGLGLLIAAIFVQRERGVKGLSLS